MLKENEFVYSVRDGYNVTQRGDVENKTSRPATLEEVQEYRQQLLVEYTTLIYEQDKEKTRQQIAKRRVDATAERIEINKRSLIDVQYYLDLKREES